MKTAQITYYGEGPLNLQLRRFKAGTSVKTRLDDILPDERRRYADRFLITGPDGLIINIGAMVPDGVAKEVIGVNPQVLRVPGFDVRIPPGFALDDTGAEPRIVEAGVMSAKMENEEKPLDQEPEVTPEDAEKAGEQAAKEFADKVKEPKPTAKEKARARKKAAVAKKTPAKKAAKKAPAKKKAAKKSAADDLMEMF